MIVTEGKKKMTAPEIQELLTLKNWSKSKLASELDLSEHAVYKWLKGQREATGPAALLMHQMLAEARAEAAQSKPRRKEAAHA